jgi:hypothetical protein
MGMYRHTPRAFAKAVLRDGLPSLIWTAGVISCAVGGSVVIVLAFGMDNLPWGVVILLAALLLVLVAGTYKLAKRLTDERDKAIKDKADAAGPAPVPVLPGAFIRAGAAHDNVVLGSDLDMPGGLIEAPGEVTGTRIEQSSVRARTDGPDSQRVARPSGTGPDCAAVGKRCADLSERIARFVASANASRPSPSLHHQEYIDASIGHLTGLMSRYRSDFGSEVEFVFEELLECGYVAADLRPWFTRPVNQLRVQAIGQRLGSIAMRLDQDSRW